MIKFNPSCGITAQNVRAILTIVILMIPLSSCHSFVTPHENFKSLMAHNIGSSIDKPNVAGSTQLQYLLKSRSLPNGNVENKYRGRGSCRIFFEFDPKTRIIINWHFEGSEQDCGIVPI